MRRLAITIGFFVLLFNSSCTEGTDENKGLLPFDTISFTQTCGWCALGSSITISQDQTIEYSKIDPCTSENTIKKERKLTDEEIQKLNDFFELSTLLAMDIDKCGVCYDGCDDALRLEGLKGESNFIRFDKLDKYNELEDIKPFIETIMEIRSSF